ncbi:MAG: hypothetical protein H6818_10275 [Phycisphaerales bacterium]|nr:hypothetical protein [Phycisphaerales bacterium]MCB9863913.1 hypothetical protein [Phycisphaerales bacterium]
MRAVQHILLVMIVTTVLAWGFSLIMGMYIETPRYFVGLQRGGILIINASAGQAGADVGGYGISFTDYSAFAATGTGTPMYLYWPHLSPSDFSIIPLWTILLIAIPPWFVLYRRARELRRRRREGCCMSCGYDLSSNESGVCPECGAAAEVRTT